MSEGRKDDEGKLRYDLVPAIALEEIAKVLTFGADKYAPNSWQKIDDLEARYTAAAFRHLQAWRMGERFDEESGLHHLSHALANMVFLLCTDLKEKKITVRDILQNTMNVYGEVSAPGWEEVIAFIGESAVKAGLE